MPACQILCLLVRVCACGSGADPNTFDTLGRTPLMLAVAHVSTQSDATFDLEDLLIRHGADVNVVDSYGAWPL